AGKVKTLGCAGELWIGGRTDQCSVEHTHGFVLVLHFHENLNVHTPPAFLHRDRLDPASVQRRKALQHRVQTLEITPDHRDETCSPCDDISRWETLAEIALHAPDRLQVRIHMMNDRVRVGSLRDNADAMPGKNLQYAGIVAFHPHHALFKHFEPDN